jgi:ATP-binding cassette, subfamily B, bacterial PglK
MNTQSPASLTSLLKRLWLHFSRRRQGQFSLLLILMVVTAFAEIVSIGAVLPFLGVLTAPERIFALPYMQPVIQLLGLNEPKELLFPLTLAFGLAALLAGGMRLILLWASTRLSFAAGADLSRGIYRRTLYQPYAVHCSRNSSEVINGISSKANDVIFSVIVPLLNFISSGIMMVAILAALLLVEPLIALVAFAGFGLIYGVIIRLTRNRLTNNSESVARESTQVIKSLQEGLGGIRDVLIDGSQASYCDIYQRSDSALRRAQGNSVFISSSPRYAMEALGMVLIAALAFTLAKDDGIAKAIPILGALALGAQRLLPVLQQAYYAWSSISGRKASLMDTLDLLDQALPEYANAPPTTPLPFENTIVLKQLGFRYSLQTPYVLHDINLTITKGSRIGFIGTTGSGKSTLLDIVMGLLQPSNGALQVDGKAITSANNRAWQTHIAHVPQAIFLADGTIEENIAFGVPPEQICPKGVRQAAEQAQIAQSIEGWPKQYRTLVGERGVRLSGGQRQRIGIARALYKQADVIVFDEATSALDNETESAVMEAIQRLNKDLTLLIVAHRISTLKNCTQIVELSGGLVKRVGNYHQIVVDEKAARVIV